LHLIKPNSSRQTGSFFNVKGGHQKMAHEQNSFVQMQDRWRQHRVYEDMGHKVVDLAMTLRHAGEIAETDASAREDITPTPFPVEFFKSLAEERDR
jgi:hypothetical protein